MVPKNYDLFTDLYKEQVYEHGEALRFIRIKKRGQTIYFVNKKGCKRFFLINGKIKISEMDGLGNEMIKDIILTGDMFGAVP